MDMYVVDSDTKVSRRGSSALIELDIAYTERRNSRRSASNSVVSQANNELDELGETLEHLTAEFGKPMEIAVDEDGCPDKPRNFRVFRNTHLKSLCNAYRESLHPVPFRFAVINFRVMRRNAGMYVGYLLTQKGLQRGDLYKAKYLPIWTHCIRIKMRVNAKIGVIFHGLKSRLGVMTLNGLHFCMDGFYGVEAYGDAFGNVGAGLCPWMELNGNGSVKSLRLKDGDNIYVSVATENMRQLARQRQKRACWSNAMSAAKTVPGGEKKLKD